MNTTHYLTETLETLDFGFAFGPTDAALSIVIVTGQHGDEFTGLRAGAAMARALAYWGVGRAAMTGTGPLPAPKHLGEIRCLVVPGLNREGIAMGTRRGVDHVDLNKSWPDRHSRTTRVWEAIAAMPGERRILIDVHGTTHNRDADPEPDSHLFVAPECANVFTAAFERSFGELLVVATNPEEDQRNGTLEGAALAAGFAATTLEIGEDETRLSADAAVLFLHRLIERITTQP